MKKNYNSPENNILFAASSKNAPFQPPDKTEALFVPSTSLKKGIKTRWPHAGIRGHNQHLAGGVLTWEKCPL